MAALSRNRITLNCWKRLGGQPSSWTRPWKNCSAVAGRQQLERPLRGDLKEFQPFIRGPPAMLSESGEYASKRGKDVEEVAAEAIGTWDFDSCAAMKSEVTAL